MRGIFGIIILGLSLHKYFTGLYDSGG